MGGKEPVKKIFVGGLDINMSEEEVKEYFAQYGQVRQLGNNLQLLHLINNVLCG
jgi:RNA recognition motif-containing protein